ncbi:UPF0175 family protein [Candidatus Albibeggiatoa sp. nov. BB20]|uniref:UPF0175 family protein n=1 Tax=Candidatus Albibeggiatoa sp. nov. BB20 TaxID=3162723 RepID=UPI0033659C55
MQVQLKPDFETILKPLGYQTVEFYLAASLYHAHKISFATAASLAGMGFDTFLNQLQEQFDVGFIMTNKSVEQDLTTVDKIIQAHS